ncbi:MAG: calcium/sodium antiporter [bacterium]|nr:calcium/sodium antiporter [bacterium]
MFIDWLVLLLSLVVLGVSAHFLVHSSVRIARLFGLSELFIGLTLVSFGTSAPEIAVSVMAALEGKGALSVGNVIGSNIFNLGFILGLVALVAVQKIHRKVVYRDGVVLLFSTFLVLSVVWDYQVSFWEGVMLLGLLATYVTSLFINKNLPPEEMKEFQEEEMMPHLKRRQQWMHLLVFFVSLYVLVLASDFTVGSATNIALVWGISEWAIGVTIVAAGTSLPEVATSVIATIKRRFDLSIGNVIGSDIFNALGIIGISAVVAPLTLQSKVDIMGMADFQFSQMLLVGTLLLTLLFMRTGWRLSRMEGLCLFLIAVSRMGFEIWMGSA